MELQRIKLKDGKGYLRRKPEKIGLGEKAGLYVDNLIKEIKEGEISIKPPKIKLLKSPWKKKKK